MITQYVVNTSNSYGNFTQTFDNLHDAEVSFEAIMKVYKCLISENIDDDYLFYVWLDKLECEILDDGTRVIKSTENICQFYSDF